MSRYQPQGGRGSLIKEYPFKMQICSRIMIGGLILSVQRVNNSSNVWHALVSRIGMPFWVSRTKHFKYVIVLLSFVCPDTYIVRPSWPQLRTHTSSCTSGVYSRQTPPVSALSLLLLGQLCSYSTVNQEDASHNEGRAHQGGFCEEALFHKK